MVWMDVARRQWVCKAEGVNMARWGWMGMDRVEMR